MAEIKSLINQEAFLAAMKEQINASLIAAAEPLVQNAMVEIEKKIRANLAAIVLGHIEHTVDIRTMSDRVVFEIKRR